MSQTKYDLLNLPEPGQTGDRSYHECVAEAMMGCMATMNSTYDEVNGWAWLLSLNHPLAGSLTIKKTGWWHLLRMAI